MTTYHEQFPTPQVRAAHLSRRGFLGAALIGGATVAVGAGVWGITSRSALANGANDIAAASIGGLLPAEHVIGGIVILGATAPHLVFDVAPSTAAATGSKAVVTLKDALAWRFRGPGDRPHDASAVDVSGLDSSSTFEVQNSAWAADVVRSAKPFQLAGIGGSGPRHYLFTFGATSFECVVGSLATAVRQDPYSVLLRQLNNS